MPTAVAARHRPVATPPAPSGATTILYVHSGGHWIRGSERCLLDLLARVDRARFSPVLWCDGSGLAAAATELGVPVRRFSGADAVETSRRPPAPLVAQARELLAEFGVGLVHANGVVPVKWLLAPVRAARIPLLAHLHLPSTPDERCFLGLHQVALAVGVSHFSVEGLLDDGMPQARVAVIYNGVDPERMERGDARGLRAELGIPRNAATWTAVTSLITRKGNDVLVRALADADRGPAAGAHHLLLVGGGPERAALEALADSLGVRARVHFLGDRTDAGAILRDATDVAVTAARAEAFPLNTLEAAYFARPVVASDIAPHRESVVDGETGVLVPTDDHAAFARAVQRLVDAAGERRRLGDAGRARVLADFLVDRYVHDFEVTYARLLARPASAYGWIRGSVFPRVYARWLGERVVARVGRLTGRRHGAVASPSAAAG